MSKLKEKRIALNLSQNQLADLSAVKVRALQEYEQGRKKIDGAKIETLLNLSTALKCPISAIIENEALSEKLKNNGY